MYEPLIAHRYFLFCLTHLFVNITKMKRNACLCRGPPKRTGSPTLILHPSTPIDPGLFGRMYLDTERKQYNNIFPNKTMSPLIKILKCKKPLNINCTQFSPVMKTI